MTSTEKPTTRRTIGYLDGFFGKDRGKRLCVTVVYEGGTDVLILRPENTQRPERIALVDVYRFAIKARVNRELLEKARKKKEKKAEIRAQRRIEYFDKKLKKSLTVN